ncbi:MAG: DUF402 domain-containing protein [Anaerolineae bacterium]
MNNFTVYKLDHRGEEILHYHGQVIARTAKMVCVQASFGGHTRDLGYVTLKHGDLFTEWFYADRWYNVFKLQDVDNGLFKGYYCNLTRPAIIADDHVKSDDLELDMFVKPDASIRLLDQDEYAALPLSITEREQVARAVRELQSLVADHAPPFDALSSSRADAD